MKTIKQIINIEIDWDKSALKKYKDSNSTPNLLINEFLPNELNLYPQLKEFKIKSRIIK